VAATDPGDLVPVGRVPVVRVPEAPERGVPELAAPGRVVPGPVVPDRVPRVPVVRGRRTPATAGVLRAGEDRREPSRRKPKVTKSTPAIEAVGSRLTRDLSRAVPNRPGSAAGAEAQNRELRILAIGPLETGVLIVPVRDGRILAARILGRRVRTKAIPALLMDAVSVSEAQRAQNLGRQVPVPESPIQTVRATLPREVPTERPGGFLSTTE
jgi:hypothetical protein